MVYRFILVSLADMCPKRPLNQIKVIFGDGIFDSTLSAGIDLRAKILGDVFHLFMSKNSNWKKGFGTDFGKIEPYLNKMIHSFSEQYYADAFNSAKELLLGKVDSLEYLSKIDKDKEMFARYLVKNTRGNMDRQGSTPAEQNHASYVSRIGPRSVENITFGISAMFERQRQLELETNQSIADYAVQCLGKRAVMEQDISHQHKMENNYAYKALFDALCKLSPWGYEIFETYVNLSHLYICTEVETGHRIQKAGSDKPPRLILFGDRCDCSANISYDDFQCYHELARDKAFRIELFNKFWLQLERIGQSYPDESMHQNEENLQINSGPRQHDGPNELYNIPADNAQDQSDASIGSVGEEDFIHPPDDDDDDDCDSFDAEFPVAFGPKKKANHRTNYSVLKGLADEIVDAVSFDAEKSTHVAGVFSYILDAIQKNQLEDATKESSLERYLSRFATEKANESNKFSSVALPVPRTVARPAGNSVCRLKSSAEIRSQGKKKSRNTKADVIGISSSQLCLTQESASSVPAPSKQSAKRTCVFCGTQEHRGWSVCKKEGKASKLNAVIVHESSHGYRSFVDNLYNPNFFLDEKATEIIDIIHDKIPQRCKHIIVIAIVQIPMTSGIVPQASTLIQYRRVLQLQLLGNNAVDLGEYNNKYFQLRPVCEWITEYGNKSKIVRRVFHRLKTLGM